MIINILTDGLNSLVRMEILEFNDREE